MAEADSLRFRQLKVPGEEPFQRFQMPRFRFPRRLFLGPLARFRQEPGPRRGGLHDLHGVDLAHRIDGYLVALRALGIDRAAFGIDLGNEGGDLRRGRATYGRKAVVALSDGPGGTRRIEQPGAFASPIGLKARIPTPTSNMEANPRRVEGRASFISAGSKDRLGSNILLRLLFDPESHIRVELYVEVDGDRLRRCLELHGRRTGGDEGVRQTDTAA